MSFWKKIDRILARVERKGFEVANKAHVYTVNVLLLGLGYGIYSMFSDYNKFFSDARVISVYNIILSE